MTETKLMPKVPTKRIFPENQWSQEKIDQWKTEIVEHRQRCQAIFNPSSCRCFICNKNCSRLALAVKTLSIISCFLSGVKGLKGLLMVLLLGIQAKRLFQSSDLIV